MNEYKCIINGNSIVRGSEHNLYIMSRTFNSVGGGSRKYKLYPIPAGFDIETTNIDETKTAYMWHWQLSFGEDVYIGRTWDSFFSCIENIKRFFNKAYVMIFIHNMGFEMSFLLPQIYKRGLLDRIFARDNREPLEVRTTNGIIFRDTLALSNLSLAELAKKYCKTQKTKDLDYSVIRNSTTPITDSDLQYCINDVVILKEYAELLHKEYTLNGNLIPLTSTGIVRQYVKKQIPAKYRKKVQYNIATLYPPTLEKYNFTMKWLFRGGFTHAQTAACDTEYNVNNPVEDNYHKCSIVDSFDLTSAYPAMMVQKLYPVTPFLKYDPKSFDKLIQNQFNAIIMVCTFTNIKAITDHVIESKNKIIYYSPNSIFENGRLYLSDSITVALTDVDYRIYKKFYTWDNMKITELQVAHKGELPKYVLNSIFYFYLEKKRLKTELKKLKENTPEYIQMSGYLQNAKGGLNANYGMMVSRLHLDEWVYDGQYIEKPIVKSNGDFKTYEDLIHEQFLSPYWGIYITAYCRETILSMISLLGSSGKGENALYSDTDSIKCLPGCDKIFDEYNRKIDDLNKGICNRYGVDFSIYGDLGKFEKEHSYIRWKTFGAKRYIYVNDDNEFGSVVAGLPKETAFKWVQDHGIDEFFKKFSPSMTFEVSGKNAHKYNDESEFVVNGELMHELGSCYIYPVSFKMTVEPAFLNIITIRKDLKGYAKN